MAINLSKFRINEVEKLALLVMSFCSFLLRNYGDRNNHDNCSANSSPNANPGGAKSIDIAIFIIEKTKYVDIEWIQSRLEV